MQRQKGLNIKMLCSNLIYPLTQFGRLGRIHSVFDRSFNIKINNFLIHIGSYEGYISSFGAFLERSDYEIIRPNINAGNLVRFEDDEIMIFDMKQILKININPIPIDLFVSQVILSQDELFIIRNALQKFINKKRYGIDLDEKNQKYLAYMKNGQSSTNLWEEILLHFIGRGKGLTPSGDDIILGYLFIMKMFDEAQFFMISGLLNTLKYSTTDVSKMYLIAGSKGYVSSPLYKFFEQIKTKASLNKIVESLSKIEHIGHSSGSDLILGMFIGIENIIKIYNWRENNGEK